MSMINFANSCPSQYSANGLQPTIDTTLQINYNAIVSQFGGSYAQIAPDGINYEQEVWTVYWDNVNQNDSANLQSFFNSVGCGQYFEWNPPSGNGTVWRIDPQNPPNMSSTGPVFTWYVNFIRVY